VKIKSIALENFKGVKSARYDFGGNNVTVSGANATGKTTIFDGVWWVLFNKDSLGNEKFSIRPLDENGQPIHSVEIKVAIVLDVNGREMELCKTQKEKWVKRRGSETTELQGNENSYEIDGYPKSERDYKLAIADLVSEDVFKMLTSPTYFTSLKWKEQRDILMRFVSEVNDYDLASEQVKFFPLMKEFTADAMGKIPSVEDVSSKFRKYLTEWKHKQAEIPVRIDEAEKSRFVIDVAELELGKKAVQELMKSNQLKQEDVSKQYEEHQKLSDGIMDLKFKLGDLERNANAGLIEKRRDLHGEIDKLQVTLKSLETKISMDTFTSKTCSDRIALNQEKIQKQRELWAEENKRVFDENSLVCPYCKQEYPQDKKDELKAEFESHKAKELSAITERGNQLKKQIDLDKSEVLVANENIKATEEEVSKIKEQISELEKQLSELPASIDVSQTDEYKEIAKQIAEKEQAMLKFNSADSIRKQLIEEERELNGQLLDFERRIASASKNTEIDERIAQLQAEQREVGQKVADQEKMLYLLEEFIRYKMDKVSESINGKFELANFILFRNLINGGLVETCECEYNGVPYSSLNSAAKIQCGLDIIRSLQKLYDTYCPVFIDNRESCTDIPTMDCQVISMYVNPEYKELKIEKEI
jgi:DNA repair exonuclease SbcCD ATPase subunit